VPCFSSVHSSRRIARRFHFLKRAQIARFITSALLNQADKKCTSNINGERGVFVLQATGILRILKTRVPFFELFSWKHVKHRESINHAATKLSELSRETEERCKRCGDFVTKSRNHETRGVKSRNKLSLVARVLQAWTLLRIHVESASTNR